MFKFTLLECYHKRYRYFVSPSILAVSPETKVSAIYGPTAARESPALVRFSAPAY
jgi:hypothetical protein